MKYFILALTILSLSSFVSPVAASAQNAGNLNKNEIIAAQGHGNHGNRGYHHGGNYGRYHQGYRNFYYETDPGFYYTTPSYYPYGNTFYWGW